MMTLARPETAHALGVDSSALLQRGCAARRRPLRGFLTRVADVLPLSRDDGSTNAPSAVSNELRARRAASSPSPPATASSCV